MSEQTGTATKEADILEPHLHRGIRNGRRLNDYQWYPLYREVVEGYPTFLDLRHFDNKWDSSIKNSDWMLPAWNAASWEGFKACLWLCLLEYSGELSANYEESRNNPIHRPIYRNLLPTDRRESNQHAGSSDDEDSDDQTTRGKRKLRMGVKRFVEKLRFILIEKLKYDMAWGLPLRIDDRRYSVVGVDKRFEEHHRMTYETESGETKEFIISRLTATWEAAGMVLMPVPDGEIAPAFYLQKLSAKVVKKRKVDGAVYQMLMREKDLIWLSSRRSRKTFS